MSLLLFIIWFLGCVYFFLIYTFYRNLPTYKITNYETKNNVNVSVIIPFRNEEENLPNLLESLQNQNYLRNKTSIIFIDDHSDDKGKEIIENFVFQNAELNIEILDLEEGRTGKKAALRKAYQHISADIILTTDADCKMHKDWISLTVMAFEEKEVQLLCGGVKMESGSSWINHFQSVELMSLIGSGAAAIQLGNPIMSNGANLAFRKSVLNEINYSNLKPNSASGDDVFLLMEVFRVMGAKAIGFLSHPQHWVTTQPLRHFEYLVQQRIRWTSKTKTYKNPFQVFVSLVVFLSNLAIPVLFLWSLFSLQIVAAFIFYWFLKILIDYMFLKKVATISAQKFDFQKYMNTAIIYPFFISYIAIIGQFTDFKWKGRNYPNK